MKTSIITAIAISVGIWSQYAVAATGKCGTNIGLPMTQDQLSANNCTVGYIVGGCTNPSQLPDTEDACNECNDWMSTVSCTECKPGYVLTEASCIPNNETGVFIGGCDPTQMSAKDKEASLFSYKCICSELFGATGQAGYLFRGCLTGSIEFKCDTDNKYYQTSSSKSPSCTVTTDSNGVFKFSRCSGCTLCNETTEYWENSGTGYQRAYRKRFTDGSPATCASYDIDKWRCAARYYGSSTNGTSGCTPCPSVENVGLTPVCNGDTCPYVTSPAGSTQITQCVATTYEPSMNVFLKDGTGKFRWINPDVEYAYGECNYK